LAAHPAPWRIAGSQLSDVIDVSVSQDDATRLVATVNGSIVSTRAITLIRNIVVNAGAGDDSITIDLGVGMEGIRASVYGGTGNDTIVGGAGNDYLDGGAGSDQINGRLGNDYIIGGVGDDMLAGDEGNDSIFGGLGKDTLVGGMGDDRLYGDLGNDMLTGGYGSDTLRGSTGSDTLQGGDGADLLISGQGKDVVNSESSDRVTGGSRDTLGNDFRTNPLVSVDDPETLKQQFIDQAVARYKDLYGQPASLWWMYYRGLVMDGVYTMASSTGAPGTNPNAADHSSTNTQVQGVDEADMVKTDGDYIYLVKDNQLVIVDAWPADESHVVSRTDIDGWGSDIYLDGTHLTVISTKWVYDETGWGVNPGWLADGTGGWTWAMAGAPAAAAVATEPAASSSVDIAPLMPYWRWLPSKAQVVVTVYDVSDAASPAIISTTTIDGSLSSSRDIKGEIYVVLDHYIDIPAPQIIPGDVADTYVYESEDAYRARLEAMTLAELFPSYTTTFADASIPAISGAVLDTPGLYAPQTPDDQSSMFSIVTIDAASDQPQIIDTTAVVGCTGQVYMSTDSLFVAATGYDAPMGGWLGDCRTDIYKFTVDDTGVALDGAGQVPGWILNSYSMDESNGYFHIATTTNQTDVSADTGDFTNTTSNNIFTMQSDGDTLEVTGSLTGLALTERLYAARFTGDRAYLVTFRQVDPLFTVDLSDPANPVVAGQLEMPGYSSYLQPIGDNLVFGIGRDADSAGHVNGLKVSLFDVSDFANPRLVDTYKFTTDTDPSLNPWWFNWTSSPAEWDPHAVSYFPQQQTLALPVLDWGWWNGAGRLELLKVDPVNGFTEIGQIQHDGQVLRSLRIGTFVYSIGTDAIKVISLDDPSKDVADVPLDLPVDSAP